MKQTGCLYLLFPCFLFLTGCTHYAGFEALLGLLTSGSTNSSAIIPATLPSGTPGTIVSSTSVSTSEGSSTAATYTVQLNTVPTSTVTVSIAFNDTQIKVNGDTSSPYSFTLSSTTAHTISILALSDAVVEGAKTYTLTHTLSSSDTDYNSGYIASLDVDVDVADNVQNAWWDATFPYRKKISFNCVHPAFTTDYTMSITIDTTDASRFAADGRNVRVLWQPASGSLSELNRIGYNWGTASTRIDFKLPSAAAANMCPEDPDGSYYLYYGKVGAPAGPEDEAQVYHAADFFNRADSTSIGAGYTEWIQNQTTFPADVLISGGSLALKGGGSDATYSGTDHILEAGAVRQISSSPMTLPFRVELDWFVPEHRDKTTAPAAVGWARDNDWHVGFSLGDFSTPDHRALYGGRTGDTDSWIAVNMLLGEGEGTSPHPDLDPVDHGCPGSPSPDCAYFVLQPRLNNGSDPTFQRINNAPAFTHNPWNWDPVPSEDVTLSLRLDVDPSARTYDVWLNGVQRINGVNFIASSASPITHMRFFQSHYPDLLAATGFDATPPHRFDNVRIYYPATGSAGIEESGP